MTLQRTFVSVGDGLYLHCVLAGPVGAPPLLVVHGGPDWDHSYLLEPLTRLGHRRLVLPDLRGCGRSSPGPCSFAAAARDLARLIAHLGLQSPDLLGFSAGGQVVQRLAEADTAWLFLHGRQDMVFPAHFAERATALLPRSRAVVLEAAGHMTHVDRPEAWISSIETFLAKRL